MKLEPWSDARELNEGERGGVDADDFVRAMVTEFHDSIGPEPFAMPLEATVFTARRA